MPEEPIEKLKRMGILAACDYRETEETERRIKALMARVTKPNRKPKLWEIRWARAVVRRRMDQNRPIPVEWLKFYYHGGTQYYTFEELWNLSRETKIDLWKDKKPTEDSVRQESLLEAAYHIRGTLGFHHRVRNKEHGRILLAEISKKIKEISGEGPLRFEDKQRIAQEYGLEKPDREEGALNACRLLKNDALHQILNREKQEQKRLIESTLQDAIGKGATFVEPSTRLPAADYDERHLLIFIPDGKGGVWPGVIDRSWLTDRDYTYDYNQLGDSPLWIQQHVTPLYQYEKGRKPDLRAPRNHTDAQLGYYVIQSTLNLFFPENMLSGNLLDYKTLSDTDKARLEELRHSAFIAIPAFGLIFVGLFGDFFTGGRGVRRNLSRKSLPSYRSIVRWLRSLDGSKSLTRGNYRAIRRLLSRVRIGAGKPVPSIYNPRGLRQNCVQCTVRGALKLYGKEMKLISPADWKTEMIWEKEAKIDPAQLEAVRKSAVRSFKNRKGETLLELSKYDAYIKHELTVAEEDIMLFIQANGLKPSEGKDFSVTYDRLRKELLEIGHDAIVLKLNGNKTGHAFLFRGGNYELNHYDDLVDFQRLITDYPSKNEFLSMEEKFRVWFLDYE